jgi:hypothetical protein
MPFRVLPLVVGIACSDSGMSAPPPVVTTVDVVLSHAELETGQFDTVVAIALDQSGTPISNPGPVTWGTAFPAVAGVHPLTDGFRGEIFAIQSGNTRISATIAGVTDSKPIVVSPPPILINEVFPNGDLPGGWVELFNPTARSVDLSGWTVTNGDVFQSFTFPAGVIVESGGYAAVNEVTLPVQLGATDAVHLFSKYGVQSDAFAWTGNTPGTSYGRCPDGRGPFVNLLTQTRKAANACP